MLTIKITPNETSNPPGKLADAEIHFGPEAGILAGLKLIGFSIWERRTGGGRNVTFPARTYAVNGERRTFALVRPIMDVNSQNTLRDAVLEAFDRFERDAYPIEAAIKAQRAKGHTSPVPVAREAANLETIPTTERAAMLLATFTANERAMVRIGMFPADKMEAAEKEGYNGHALTVALMAQEANERNAVLDRPAPRDSRITSEAPPARKEAIPPQDLF